MTFAEREGAPHDLQVHAGSAAITAPVPLLLTCPTCPGLCLKTLIMLSASATTSIFGHYRDFEAIVFPWMDSLPIPGIRSRIALNISCNGDP
jgi:hypothetical protein